MGGGGGGAVSAVVTVSLHFISKEITLFRLISPVFIESNFAKSFNLFPIRSFGPGFLS